MESASIDLNRSRIRFSDIQLEEIAKRNFTGQHYTVTDIHPLLLFLLFYAIIDSSLSSPHKSLLISLMSVNFQHTHLDLILTNDPYKGTVSWFWSSTKQLLLLRPRGAHHGLLIRLSKILRTMLMKADVIHLSR